MTMTVMEAGTLTQRTATTQLRQRWVLACVAAEAIGMTAAAAAARSATWLTDERGAAASLALLVVVAGGLVEGTALGVLQARRLEPRVGRVAARRWVLATVTVAGLGWAAASAPATLSSDPAGTTPPLSLVLLGAAALGAAMGAVLGAAQAWSVRHAARSRRAWIGASVLGWTAAMPVIFLGATAPGADWSAPAVVLLGAATGAAAGGVLGVLTMRAAAALVAD